MVSLRRFAYTRLFLHTKAALALLAALICLPGCPPQGYPQQTTAALLPFQSSQDLLAYFKLAVLGDSPDSGSPLTGYSPGIINPYNSLADTVGGLTDSPLSWPSADAGASACTNGRFIYMLSDYDLSIVQTDPPAQLRIAGRFELMDYLPPKALFLFGDQAVIVTSSDYAYGYGWTYMIGDDWLPDGTPFFEVLVIDVADPAAPHLLRRYSFQGQPLACQVVDGKLLLVSATYPTGEYNANIPADMATVTETDILPKYRVADEFGHDTVAPLVTWESVRRPATPDGSALTTITTLALGDTPAQPQSTAVMAFWQCLYITPRSLYLTNSPLTPDNHYRTTTDVHKFDLSGPAARYVAGTTVDGRPPMSWYNIFSETDTSLRMILETPDHFRFDLAILQQQGDHLQPVGRLDDLATDVGISDFTFCGDHLLLWDYDPSIPPRHVDLHDPAAPTATGPMELPFDLAAMHMLDATHLLAVGFETASADAARRTYGDLCLWILDMSNGKHPAILHRQVIGAGATYSPAVSYAYEASALTNIPLTLTDGLLALPVRLYEGTYPPDTGVQTFAGQYFYRLSVQNGFDFLGKVTTVDAYYYIDWERVFFLTPAIYSVSNGAVKAVDWNHLDQTAAEIRVPGFSD